MKKLFLFALVATMFAACVTDETRDVATEVTPETLTVSFEGADSRVQLDNGKTVWTKGDLVSVFYRSNSNDQYEFQGETGDTEGTLKRNFRGGNASIGFDKIVAVYPYNSSNLIEMQTGNIQAFIPATQNYVKDSFGVGSSLMISSSRTNTLYMKNVCGWLKLQLTGNVNVRSIVLKGNNGEQVAGNVFVAADTAECTLATALNGADENNSGDLVGTLVEPNTILTEVTLDCGDGVALGVEPTAFYIALPPQTFSKGITFEVTATDGTTTMTKSTDKEVVIERNHILPMAAVDFGANEAMAEISINPTSFATDLMGGEQVITVNSNATWTVSCNEADVVIEPCVGAGNGTVAIIVPAASTREFKVVFRASKLTSIPALGTAVPTIAEAELAISQNAGGIDMSNFLYYETVGDDVEKNAEGYWPYVDAFEGWNLYGAAAAGVTYSGSSASVRNSGKAYQPTSDAVGISGAPYVFLNKVPASAYFVIENIAVTGGSNYIFTYNVSCQNAYNGGTPGFATVDGSLVHLELGYDGTNWDKVECTYAPNGGNGWYAATAEFKVAADATKLYARFTYEAPASNGGGRFDDFKLVAGGNGAELTPEAPQQPESPEQPTDPLTLPYTESFASNQGSFTIENVVLPDALSYVWAFAAGYGMKGSAYANSTCYAAESWLVSPQISLVGATAPVATFSHCVNKLTGDTPAEAFTLHIKEVGGAWNELAIPTHGTGNSWTFVESGDIDLSAYVGKNIQIGFKYTSTAASAGTWEVKNFKVAEGNGSTTEPEQPGQGGNEGGETPVDGDFFSDDAFVDSSQNYNAQANVNGSATVNSSGFKLGTSKLTGYFESKALGVEGDKVLEFYAVAWKGKSATLYVRKKGTTELLGQFTLKANDGATGNPPYLSITLTESDYYTVNVPGVTADTVLEFSTDASFAKVENMTSGRAIVFGAHIK